MGKSQSEKFSLLTNSDKKFEKSIVLLWDRYSGLPGLLDGRNYEYSQNKMAYVHKRTGRVIDDRQLRAAVKRVSTEQRSQMRKTTQQLIAGTIIASIWYLRMETLMATLYKTLWLLSIGGFLFDDNTTRNIFYALVMMQFKWLDNFYDQIKEKNQPLNGTAMVRAGLYGEYGNSFYQNAMLRRMEEAGFTEAKRILGTNEEHCYKSHERLGCIELAQKGWVSIERVVPIGDATCYSNCHCHLVFR